MAHLLLLCFLLLLNFFLDLWIDLKEPVLVEAADSLLDVEGALLQHLFEFGGLAELTFDNLLVDIVCNGLFVLVGEESVQRLMF